MISNLWNDTQIYCTNGHNEPQRMVLQQIGSKLIYVCPKHAKENCVDGESCCKNKLSVIEFEKMLNHIDSVLTDAVMDGSEINLTNYKWKKKSISYRIMEHKKKIKVEVLNKEEINQ